MLGSTATLNIEVAIAADGTMKVLRQLGNETDKSADKGEKSFKRMNKSLGDFDRSTVSAYRNLLRLAGAYVSLAALARTYSEMETAASRLQETQSKFDVVFAGQEKAAAAWADELQDSYYMSERASKQYLSGIQDMLVPMGMAADAAGAMSSQAVKLASDLGSFNDMPTAEVLANIQSGLVGEYEPMRKYGVVLSAATVQQKALNMGLAETTKELTFAHKAQAAFQMMVESSTAALGDTVRTADEHANTVKRLEGAWEDFAAVMGDKFLDVATKVKSISAAILENMTKMLKGPDVSSLLDEQIAKIEIRMAELKTELAMSPEEKASAEKAQRDAKEEQRINERIRLQDEAIEKILESAQAEQERLETIEEYNKKAYDTVAANDKSLIVEKQLLALEKELNELLRIRKELKDKGGQKPPPAGGGGGDQSPSPDLDAWSKIALGQIEDVWLRWDKWEADRVAADERAVQMINAAIQAELTAEQAAADEKTRLLEEWAEEHDRIGKSAYELEKERIFEQAQIWRAAGADEVELREWILDQLYKNSMNHLEREEGIWDDFFSDLSYGFYAIGDSWDDVLDSMLQSTQRAVASMAKTFMTDLVSDKIPGDLGKSLGGLVGGVAGSVVGTGIGALISGIFGSDEPDYDPAARASMLSQLNQTIAGEAKTLEASLSVLTAEYQEQYRQATELHISAAKVTAAYMAEAERIKQEWADKVEAFRTGLLLIVSPELADDLAYQIELINREYDEQAEQARNLGVSLELVNLAREKEIELLEQQRVKQQRLWAESLQGSIAGQTAGLTGLLSSITSYQTGIARKGWGVSDYEALRDDLTVQLANLDDNATDYYDRSLDILSELFDVEQQIASLTEESLAQQEIMAGALAGTTAQLYDTIAEITGGGLAAVQSAEYFETEFNRLIAGVYNATDMASMSEYAGQLNEFIPQFLEFMSTYEGDQAGVNAQAVDELSALGEYLVESGLNQYGAAFADLFEAPDWEAIMQNDQLRQLYEQIAENTSQTAGALGSGNPYLVTVIARLNDQIGLMGAQLTGQALMDLGVASTTGGVSGLANSNLLVQAASLGGYDSAGDLAKQLAGGLPAGGTSAISMLGGTLYVGTSPVDAGNLAAQFVYGEGGANPLLAWQAQQQAMWDAEREAVQAWLLGKAGSIEASYAQYVRESNMGNDESHSVDYQALHGNIANAIMSQLLAGKDIYLDYVDQLLNHGGQLSMDMIPWWGNKAIYEGLGFEGILRYGGLASGPSVAGEYGDEWVVPTYEPERSRFLSDVGADPAAIGRAVARQIAPLMGNQPIQVQVVVDGRVLGSVCARQAKSNPEFVAAIRSVN